MKRMFVAGSVKVKMPSSGAGKATKLLSILSSSDFELTVDAEADCFLSIDHNEVAYRSYLRMGGTPDRAFLVRLEPPSVFPAQYRGSIAEKYRCIYSPGSVLQNPSGFFGWPYQKYANPNIPTVSAEGIDESFYPEITQYYEWVNRSIVLSMVAANKVAPAFGQHYALRRKFAHNLQSLDFQLYGPLWSAPIRLKIRHRLAVTYFAIRQGTIPNLNSIWGNLLFNYPRSLGEVHDKHEVLKDSKFSLVFENSDTYVSEKLFDSIINGCIPVYFGPELSKVGLPDNLIIKYMGPIEDLVLFLEELSQDTIQEKLNAISEFLHSKDFKENWFETSVYQRIVKDITYQTNGICSL